MVFARRGVLYGLYVVLAVPVLGVAASAGWLYSDIYLTAEKYEQVLDTVATNQIPTEPSEFTRIDLPNKSQDAFVALQSLDKKWQALSSEDRTQIQNHFRAYSTPTEMENGETASTVKANLSYLKLYSEAANKKDSNFARDWSSCEPPFEPNYHTIVEVSRLNCSYAIGLARTNSAQQAFATLHNTRKLAKHISRDSGLDGLALHSLLETMSLTAAEQIEFLYGDRPEVNREFEKFINNRSTMPNVVRNLEGEAMRTIIVLSEPESYKNRIFAGAKLSLRGEVFQKAATVRMAEFWNSSIDSVRTVSPDAIASSEAFRESVEEFQREKSPSRLVPSSIAEWHEYRLRSVAALEVRYKLAGIVSKIFQQYHRTGKFPAGLSDLNIPLNDPMTGDPFNYTIIEGGFQLFGRGSNNLDDDGFNNADIVLRLNNGVVANEGV